MRITNKTIRALKILNVEDERGLTAREFARQMWPDSPGWNKISNTGNGACYGKGMWLAGGGYLAKLKKKGLVTSRLDIRIMVSYFSTSKAGKDLLLMQKKEA